MKEKILFLTAYVPNKAAAGEKNTMIMLNDLASCYDVNLNMIGKMIMCPKEEM